LAYDSDGATEVSMNLLKPQRFVSFRIYILIIFFVVLGTPISYAAKKFQCATLMESVVSKESGGFSSRVKRSESFNRISELIDRDFDGVNLIQAFYHPNWLNRQRMHQDTAKFHWVIDELLKLAPKERSTLYKKITKKYREPIKQLPLNFLLCFDATSLWLDFIEGDALATAQQGGYWMLNSTDGYRRQIENLPQSLKIQLLERIAHLYPIVEKDGEGVNGPKRLLDGWIRALLPGDKIFNESFAKNHDALKAYSAYLKALKKYVIDKMPVNSKKYGFLNASDILTLAKTAQKFLKDKDVQFYLFAQSGHASLPEPMKILFHGSTVKGMAKYESDLDMGISNWDHINNKLLMDGLSWGYGPESYHVAGLTERFNIVALEKFPELRLKFDSSPHNYNDVIMWSHDIEPFMIEISERGVNLLVLPLDESGNRLPPKKYKLPN